MSLKFTGGFSPGGVTGVKIADGAPGLPQFGGFAWTLAEEDSGLFVVDGNTVDMIYDPSNPQVTAYSELLEGDFNFSINFSMPANQGLMRLSVVDENDSGAIVTGGQGFIVEVAAYNAYLSGQPFNRIGYPSYAYSIGICSSPTNLTLSRTGSSIVGVGQYKTSGTLPYASPVKIQFQYIKSTGAGNVNSANTITVTSNN